MQTKKKHNKVSEQKDKIPNKVWEKKHRFIPITPYSFLMYSPNQSHKPIRNIKLVMTPNWLNCVTSRPHFFNNTSWLYWQAPCTYINLSVKVWASLQVWQYITLFLSMCQLSAAPCDNSLTCSKAAHSENVRKTPRVTKRVTKIRKAHPHPAVIPKPNIVGRKNSSVLTSLTFAD